jgi:hypothetical protein
MRGDKDSDPLTQSWRLDHGYKLRTIAYYSKTLDQAQRNYPTFDKESAAILFCVRRWAKIITGSQAHDTVHRLVGSRVDAA